MDARTSRYHEVYARWQRDPQGFWAEAAQAIDWIEPATRVFDPGAGVYGRWFVGGVCNTCWNAVDRHVLRSRGDQPAIIYDSPLAGHKRTLTYHDLQVETQVLAAILRNLGIGKGDRVVIYMPMVPEAVIAMLACARIGAVHSVVFGGFAAKELATRIDDATPKVILSASCGLEIGRVVKYKPLLDEAIALAAHKPDACVVLQRPQEQAALVAGRDHDWAALRDEAMAANRSVASLTGSAEIARSRTFACFFLGCARRLGLTAGRRAGLRLIRRPPSSPHRQWPAQAAHSSCPDASPVPGQGSRASCPAAY